MESEIGLADLVSDLVCNGISPLSREEFLCIASFPFACCKLFHSMPKRLLKLLVIG